MELYNKIILLFLFYGLENHIEYNDIILQDYNEYWIQINAYISCSTVDVSPQSRNKHIGSWDLNGIQLTIFGGRNGYNTTSTANTKTDTQSKYKKEWN